MNYTLADLAAMGNIQKTFGTDFYGGRVAMARRHRSHRGRKEGLRKKGRKTGNMHRITQLVGELAKPYKKNAPRIAMDDDPFPELKNRDIRRALGTKRRRKKFLDNYTIQVEPAKTKTFEKVKEAVAQGKIAPAEAKIQLQKPAQISTPNFEKQTS